MKKEYERFIIFYKENPEEWTKKFIKYNLENNNKEIIEDFINELRSELMFSHNKLLMKMYNHISIELMFK